MPESSCRMDSVITDAALYGRLTGDLVHSRVWVEALADVDVHARNDFKYWHKAGCTDLGWKVTPKSEHAPV
jgi:hypothetical protein